MDAGGFNLGDDVLQFLLYEVHPGRWENTDWGGGRGSWRRARRLSQEARLTVQHH